MSKYVFEKFKQINLESSFPNPSLPCAITPGGCLSLQPLVTQDPVLLLVFVVRVGCRGSDFCHSPYSMIVCHFNARITFSEYDSSLVTGF